MKRKVLPGMGYPGLGCSGLGFPGLGLPGLVLPVLGFSGDPVPSLCKKNYFFRPTYLPERRSPSSSYQTVKLFGRHFLLSSK